MKRKSKQNLITLLWLLPWWMSALFAPFSYWLINDTLPGVQVDNPLILAALRGIQPLAPMVAVGFLSIALVAFLRQLIYRKRRRRLLDRQKGISTIRQLSWLQFEWVIGEVFRRRGFRVAETASGADEGVDLVLRGKGEHVVVQCKHWRAAKVSVGAVRELLGSVHAHKANRGVFVCTGEYTRPAREFAKANGIELLNGEGLDAAIKELNGFVSATPLRGQPVN